MSEPVRELLAFSAVLALIIVRNGELTAIGRGRRVCQSQTSRGVDKYGLSWQVIPEILGALLSHKDRAKSGRAMQAMLEMRKIDIKALKEATQPGVK